MRLIDLSKQIGSSIIQNKVRTGLTILGIVIGISSVILMLSIGQGAQTSVQENIASIGSQVITLSSTDAKYPLHFSDTAMLKEQIPEILTLSAVVQKNSEIIYKDNSPLATIYGIESSYEELQNVEMLDGQFFTEEEVQERAKVVVIGSSLEEELFEKEVGLGQYVLVNGTPHAVVGVFDSSSGSDFGFGFSLYMPISSFLSYVSKEENPSSIALKASSTELIPSIEPFITDLMHKSRDLPSSEEVFEANDLTSLLEAANQVTQIFTYLLAAIGSISLLVGGIGIMNMMLTTVTERTREIGLRKALGARKEDIVLQFLMESAVLTLIGGILGILIGAGISWLIGQVSSFKPEVTLSSILVALLFSTAVGLFFGYYPSKKAANLNPIEALRYE